MTPIRLFQTSGRENIQRQPSMARENGPDLPTSNKLAPPGAGSVARVHSLASDTSPSIAFNQFPHYFLFSSSFTYFILIVESIPNCWQAINRPKW